MKKSCENCTKWHAGPNHVEGMGECRSKPPHHSARWPLTTRDQWCDWFRADGDSFGRVLAAAVEAEAALGGNLHWLADRLDLQIRQQDAETVSRLARLNKAWHGLAKAVSNPGREA